jgi:alpha-tubulin suppressor-like RCC1 family protein
MQSGVIECMGDNQGQELSTATTAESSAAAIVIPGITNAVKISGSFYHFCATLITGAVNCWGSNAYLGNNSSAPSAPVVNVLGLVGPVTTVIAGQQDTCALLPNAVQCWGDNSEGQLGIDSTNPTVNVMEIPGVTTAKSVAVGTYTICLLMGSPGSVQCYGAGTNGQLGQGTYANSLTAVTVQDKTGSSPANITTATAISASYNSECAYTSSNQILCWGDNTYGELGNATTNTSNYAVLVSNFP